jgi:RNA polymerase sigma-70 factor, ECF subfamily
MTGPLQHTIDAVWRAESARVVATVTRIVRDVGVAEDLAQDALVAALEHWPRTGVPDNPGAWLVAAAKHKAIDRLRRNRLVQRKHEELHRELDGAWQDMAGPDDADALDDDIGDDLLRLVFVACHPVLPTPSRVALTLRLLCGLTTAEIARAFLVPEATVAQRIVRAKRTLGSGQVSYEVPRGSELAERLSSVLEVVYLVFNEGYAATAGEDLLRPGLCAEALRLGRVLATIAPREPEVHGLLALMELQAARLPARTAPSGEPVLLLEQDRRLWDAAAIERGAAALALAETLGGGALPYTLQAGIAACHARAAAPGDTDWPRIAGLYARLAKVAPSPVIELNRAVAVAMTDGPQAALAIVDGLAGDKAMQGYHLLPTVRGDLLQRLGRHDEAGREFRRAAGLAGNARERVLLQARAADASRAARPRTDT